MQGKAKTMQAAFEALFEMNGAPNNAALFTGHDEHFEKYYFYFSPGRRSRDCTLTGRGLCRGALPPTGSGRALTDATRLVIPMLVKRC